MTWIDKNLRPSLKLIDGFKKMQKGKIDGIFSMKDRTVGFSKTDNKITLQIETFASEYTSIESAKISNLSEYIFTHNHRKYIIPQGLSRIVKRRDNVFHGGRNSFSDEIGVDVMYSSKIDISNKYYFRYCIPINSKLSFDDYQHYGFKCDGKQLGGLIKISHSNDEIHLYYFKYKNDFFLVIESSIKCNIEEIEKKAYCTLLTLGFFSGTLHLNEVYIVASKRITFNAPVGMYYKSLRESITSQYSIFTTNAYSVLMPIAKKMKAKNAEQRMMSILEKKWRFRINCVPQDVFSNMVGMFIDSDSLARAAQIILTASRLSLELQSGVYCISFETICNKINRIKKLVPPHVIDNHSWEKNIMPALLNELSKLRLSKDAFSFVRNKIKNINQPTNKDKLMLSFSSIGYNLSDEEIKAINDRNLFLHGHLNIRTNENKIDKLFYTSLMFHRLCCILILKTSGFNGHIINNLSLFASNINKPTTKWGFEQI